ncbi:putative reverse transcriptase domain-containing protein [Tanacetum coccineum]
MLVERELAISKESVSETVRWISYGPCAIVVKYDAYNINGYTFRTKCHDDKVYQNSGVSVEAIDLHISKEVAIIRQAFYYGVLQEIWVLDYHFRKIPLFKCDWVNHKAGGVKHDNLRYTLVDLNNLGHKVDQFILASQARQVFYVKDQIDKKLSIVFKTPPKNYKDTYDEVDEEFSIVIHQRNDNILPSCTLHLQLAYAHCICTLHLQLAFASKHLHIAFADCICTLLLYIAFAACICKQAFAHCTCTLHLQAKDGSDNVIKSDIPVSYANRLNDEPSKKVANNCLLIAPASNGVDVVGKRVVYQVVENYVKNACSRFGLVCTMMKSKGVFFFKFSSNARMESMLENGPWLIRYVPLILCKWSRLANVSN